MVCRSEQQTYCYNTTAAARPVVPNKGGKLGPNVLDHAAAAHAARRGAKRSPDSVTAVQHDGSASAREAVKGFAHQAADLCDV